MVQLAELYPLPAPDYRAGYLRTFVTIYGAKDFNHVDRENRVRASDQHCALKRVMSEKMTNQSFRQRFHLPESKSAVVSQVIAASIDMGLLKLEEKFGNSRKYAGYLPLWT